MDFYLLLIILVSLIGIKINIKKFNMDYLSKDDTACIKGIFILIVFYSHFIGYGKLNLHYNEYMLLVRNFLGQLMVSLFLFYSGYGVFESIKNKKDYVSQIPKKRILKTLFHFDLIVMVFYFVNLFTGVNRGLKDVLLSLIGWDCLGNSNWYIFGILCLYFITYLAFTLFNDQKKGKAILTTFVLTYLLIIFLDIYKDDYWFNTLFCYPLGMLYAYNKTNIEEFIAGNNKKYVIIMALLLFAFCIYNKYLGLGYMKYEIYAMLFSLIVVGITLKVHFTSKILKWFGDNLFWFYILQRIPMLILHRIHYLAPHPVKAFVISFAATIILTIIFKFIIKYIDECIFTKIPNFLKHRTIKSN